MGTVTRPPYFYGKMEKIPVKVGATILLLNSTYEPISLCSWKRATVLVLKNKAHVVSNRTLRLKYYVKVPARRGAVGKPTRSLILKRDRHTCQYCGYIGDKLTVDHVVPKSRGGGETWENLAASCINCNNCKADRTPEEWATELDRVFKKEVTNVSAMPFSWDAFQIGMLECRVRNTGTVLVTKPKAPFNKITVTISTSDVDEWREYIYV